MVVVPGLEDLEASSADTFQRGKDVSRALPRAEAEDTNEGLNDELGLRGRCSLRRNGKDLKGFKSTGKSDASEQ